MTLLRVLAVVTTAIGVVAQFLQRTDPLFPLWYFTVDSAVLAIAALVWSPVRGKGSGWVLDRLRGASAVGVVLSALLYITVIAPGTPSGTWFNEHDDTWSRVATLALHGATPVIVVVEFLRLPYGRPTNAVEAVMLLWWPSVYLITMGSLAAAGVAVIPYPFLRPSVFGFVGVAISVLVLAGVAFLIALVLLRIHRFIAFLRRDETT
jgi:hypothetical protein